jgi:hypothetical protein
MFDHFRQASSPIAKHAPPGDATPKKAGEKCARRLHERHQRNAGLAAREDSWRHRPARAGAVKRVREARSGTVEHRLQARRQFEWSDRRRRRPLP